MNNELKYKILFDKLEEVKKQQSDIFNTNINEISALDHEIRELKSIIEGYTSETISTFTGC
jgi:uncharacterized protein YerC